jgi:hypothetical protein
MLADANISMFLNITNSIQKLRLLLGVSHGFSQISTELITPNL